MDKKLLGLRIKQLRSEYGLNICKKFGQKDLATEIGISRSYLGDIESGRTPPSDEILEKLSKFFNVSTDYLLGKTSERYPGEIEDLGNELMEKLKEKLPTMDEKTKNKIKKLLDDV